MLHNIYEPSTERCGKCNGSGTMMGNGMMYQDCYHDITVPANIDKRSKQYRDAVKKIADTQGLSMAEARKVFDEEFDRLD